MPFDQRGFSEPDDAIARELVKLDQLERMLAKPEYWCKGTLRTEDGRRCIAGAMLGIPGGETLYWPILQAAREVTGRSLGSITVEFNDHWLTNFRTVLRVISRARGIIRGEPPPERGWRGVWRSFWRGVKAMEAALG